VHIGSSHQFHINKISDAPATSYFSCFGDPGCFFKTAENVSGESRFQTTLACRHGRRCKLRGGSGAESRADFIHKLRIVLKELNEAAAWIQLILENSMLPAEMISKIITENEELCRIIAAPIKTAGGFERG
jgi:hypothetical protein